MKHIMHVRLALLTLGCIIFGVEARRGDCGCCPSRLIPGPRGLMGPVGPTGPCCLTGSTGVGSNPIYASFYNTATITGPGNNTFVGMAFPNTLTNIGGITATTGTSGTTFKFPVSGSYRLSFSAWASLPQSGGGYIALTNVSSPAVGILPTGWAVFCSGLAGSGSNLSINNDVVVNLDSSQLYSLSIASYDGPVPFVLGNPSLVTPFGVPSVSVTFEYLGAAS